MQEAVLEKVEKEKADEQWNKFHEAEASENGSSASERQKAYIVTLARTVGLRMDISKVQSRDEASRLIENLKLLSRRMNGNGFSTDLRDKRVAFGMATKLVFRKYMDRHKEVRRSKKFWQEVQQFYRDYQQNQEIAILEATEGA